jgi:amidase
VAVAAGLVVAAVGTETDGSIVAPASVCGVVGLKPTIGVIPQAGIVPISKSQDSAGPIARNVSDAAHLLAAMTPAGFRTDYVDAASRADMAGMRIGVGREMSGFSPQTDDVFERALVAMRDAGATLVDIEGMSSPPEFEDHELRILLCEFKDGINQYLATRTPGSPRTLTELIAFNIDHGAEELALFGQELFEMAEATDGLDDPGYRGAVDIAQPFARRIIDDTISANGLDAIVAKSLGPAWPIGDSDPDDIEGTSSLSAVAGYPLITVPAGFFGALPVGVTFLGGAWSESKLLAVASGFEASIG